jgi:hypothetical protein
VTNAASVNADVTALLRARDALIMVRTDDEFRTEMALVAAAAAAKYETRV